MAITCNTSFGGCGFLKFLAIEKCLPNFSAHVYYGQTAGWIRMPLGTQVSISPGDILLDGDLAPSYGKEHSSPLPTFRPIALSRIPAGPPFTHNPYCRVPVFSISQCAACGSRGNPTE